MRLSSKAGPGWDTETGVRTQPEIKQHVAGRVHKCENCDKCTSFLSRTSHVADSALRQVHVTMEKQTEKERLSHTDRLSPTGRRRKIKSESKIYRERGRGGTFSVIHGDFYRFRKVSPPITVQNQLCITHTVPGNTSSHSLYLTFLLICHLSLYQKCRHKHTEGDDWI